MTKPLKPVAVKKLLGIRNTLRPERQPWGACAEAVNVWIDDSFTAEAREGYTLEEPLTTARGLYGARSHDGLFALADGSLISFNDTLTPVTIASGLTDTALQWAELGDRVFYAGAADAGIIVDRAHWQPLRIPVPAFSLDILVSPAELLPGSAGGQYQVTVTLTHTASGIEGPAAPVQIIDLTGDQTPVAIVDTPAGYTANQYISEANGSVLYCDGVPLGHEQRDAEAFPTGVTALAAGGGVLYTAVYDATHDVSFVHWSQTFFFTCWRLDADYVPVPGKIVGLAALPQGLLILTDVACWLWANETLQGLAEYGAVAGRPIAYDHEGHPFVWTAHGLCTLTADGWQNLTGGHVSVPPGIGCTAQVVERQGHSFFMVVTDGEGDPANAYGVVAGDTWVVNVRHGELTRFDTFAFLDFACLDGTVYALRADGLYRLGGRSDGLDDEGEPVPIVARFALHPTNFGETTLKRCTYAYLTGCDEATLTVAVVCDGEVVGSYSGQRRVPLSRGVKGEFWAFEVSDPYGGPLRLTGFEILVEPTTRRV